ncbi:MAG TPA: BMP family ABC transporter substrate-binding protein [Mesotoga sp.]|jgi:basic membrane protein A|nr:BMP family ABC transporter substrate-binding protein [Mesotoga sp.]MDD4479436.1 BMP family ABC transporter substrate-binding protein [Mesotoga sp.]MDD5744262.1 BMP family ABC transporter substrate-binding protein [Mesotoga sp.]HOI63420.1 BMP family ABC transporter substrate-binding protein [Mesotoga sp.]HOY27093.1 BMP family ABC transporter substrate-binding protein [Mesotoga sp.]
MSTFSPKTFLASPVWNWGVFYEKVVREVMDKNWKSYQYWGGIKDAIVDISMSPLVPQTISDNVRAEREKIISNDLHPFEGPLYDQSGKMRCSAGERPSDDELLSMNWFVRNVVGEP